MNLYYNGNVSEVKIEKLANSIGLSVHDYLSLPLEYQNALIKGAIITEKFDNIVVLEKTENMKKKVLSIFQKGNRRR